MRTFKATCPMRAESFHADRHRNDAANWRFRNFVRAPKNVLYLMAFLGLIMLAKLFLMSDNRSQFTAFCRL